MPVRLAKDKEDPSTHGVVAAFTRRVEAEDLIDRPVAPSARVEMSGHRGDAEEPKQRRQPQGDLELVPRRRDRMCPELRGDDRANAAPRERARQEGDEKRQRADAVHDGLNIPLPGAREYCMHDRW